MDAAFKSAPFPACTTAELMAAAENPTTPAETVIRMNDEIARRLRVAQGDYSDSTPAERLRGKGGDWIVKFGERNSAGPYRYFGDAVAERALLLASGWQAVTIEREAGE